jgi:TnpA family transposase
LLCAICSVFRFAPRIRDLADKRLYMGLLQERDRYLR